MKTKQENTEDFLSAYITCALWSSNDGDDPLDSHYGSWDISEETIAKMRADCVAFIAANSEDIAAGCTRGSGQFSCWEKAGQDFWLTRCGRGAGFWDGDWRDGYDRSREKRLTDSAHSFSNVDLCIGDDKLIYS